MTKVLSIIFFVLSAWGANAQSTSLTVISNAKGAPPDLKFTELKSIMLGERQRWRNGNKIVIGLMKTNTALGKTISEKIYNMTPDEVRKYWLALVFQGKADAPTFFNTPNELQAFVADNPGAVGIVEQVLPGYNTTVVSIDGRRTF